MRILFCNKYNYAFSGTEVYMFAAMELLRSEGHEVALFSMQDSRGEPTPYDRHFMPHADFKTAGWLQKIRLAGRAIYSFQARRRLRAMIQDFRPDVAHVRNIYHYLSPSILWELKSQNVPVIYHINDFKALCPSYNLVNHGKACEACKGGKFWRAMLEPCYPGGAARAMLVGEAYVHRWLGTYRKCVDCFLAPSQFVRDKFVEHGWDAAKFEVLPHFQSVQPLAFPRPHNAPALYFGRLSAEKGVDDLLHAMRQLPNLQLVIAGDGPERSHLQRTADELRLKNVVFAGPLHGVQLDRAIAESRFSVLPTHAYETLGKTILESHAHGRAVIASDLGSRRELIQSGRNGLLYPVGDVNQLAQSMQLLSDRPELAEQMGKAGWHEVSEKYAPQAHYDALIDLYERVVRNKKRRTRGTAPAAPQKPALRVAFIGGRGVVSKYSGIESYYEEVGSRQAAMGHEITAYCRTYFTPEIEQHRGMRIVRLPSVRTKHLETLLHTFLSTIHVLFQQCDVVHYHALGPALFSFIPRLVGKKTVVTVQGLDWQRKKWGRIASAVLRIGEAAAVKLPTRTIVVSGELQHYYRRQYGAETFYVPNGGVMRERRTPEKILEWGLDPGRYVLFLGRFSPEKGCHLLVEAFEKLNTDVKLVLAGASSYCDDYSRRLRSHASEKIIFLDWVSGETLDELLTNAMIFVLPSDLEGLSLALLDAMGAGLCVLASDVPENREAVAQAGFTFTRGDATDLARRLSFLIANPSVRAAAGRTARKRVNKHYLWSKIASDVEKIYFETLGRDLPETPIKKPGARAVSSDVSQRKAG